MVLFFICTSLLMKLAWVWKVKCGHLQYGSWNVLAIVSKQICVNEIDFNFSFPWKRPLIQNFNFYLWAIQLWKLWIVLKGRLVKQSCFTLKLLGRSLLVYSFPVQFLVSLVKFILMDLCLFQNDLFVFCKSVNIVLLSIPKSPKCSCPLKILN
jgi:hypothetical protein